MADARMGIEDLAEAWIHNRNVGLEHARDYGRRTGMTVDEVVAERQSHWVRDPRGEDVGTFSGYELHVCPFNGSWRYTVVTPWGESEGLCDMAERDDDSSILRLGMVIGAISAADESHTSDSKAVPAPVRAVSDSKPTTGPKAAQKRPQRARKPQKMVSFFSGLEEQVAEHNKKYDEAAGRARRTRKELSL